MRVLLTGGSGFIGRNILESSLADEHHIMAPTHSELDCSDEKSVDNFFRSNQVDIIIHSAGKPGHRNSRDSSNLFYANTRMFHLLARHAPDCEKFIVLGSGAIYDMRDYRPLMREDEWRERVPADEHGFAKYVCGHAIEASTNMYDLRVFGIFGPYEDYAIRFISNMICKALFDLPLTMKQNRIFSYLYVADLILILSIIMRSQPNHHSYNITPDERWDLRSLANLVLEVSGKSLPVVIASEGWGSEYSGSNERLSKEFSPRFTPMTEAVETLWKWYSRRSDSIDRGSLLLDR